MVTPKTMKGDLQGSVLISPASLVKMLSLNPAKLLIIDSRSLLDFNLSCIRSAINVCCSRLVKRRLQQGKLSINDLLPTDPCCVVLYDERSELPPTAPASSQPQAQFKHSDGNAGNSDNACFVYLLLQRLAAKYSTVRLLQGGFASFAASYPQYCESKCPAMAAPAVVDTVDGCCQHGGRYLAEPSYASQGPTQLLSFVFVGSQSDACDAEVIKRHGITHVLNVSANCIQSQHVPEQNFMRVPVNDGYADKLLPHFKRAFQFLDEVRNSNGRCLVHCLAGISRSPTVSIAYIMQHLGLSQDEAYRYVKSRRPSISPNFNFLGQLLEFERQLQQQKQQQQQQPVLATSTSSSSCGNSENDEAELACSEAKRQRRFCLSLPPAAPSPTPTGALSRLTFSSVQQQQQQQQQHPAAATAPPILNSCERRHLLKKRPRLQRRPNSEVLRDEDANAEAPESSGSNLAPATPPPPHPPQSLSAAKVVRSASQELITCST